jgi:aminoglycoside 2''-phosphotransferase
MYILSTKTNLGQGFSNAVHAGAEGRILRKALTEEAGEALIHQCRFLPWLAQRLPIAIPIPESLINNVLTYPNLPGRTLTPELVIAHGPNRVAAQLTEFISVLHALPVPECIAAGAPQQSRTESLLRAFERTLVVLPAGQRREAEMWRQQFVTADSATAMIHGDLWFENILIDSANGRVSGILDFDTASIGDPAWDLATQLHLGPEFFRLVLDAYPNKSAELSERAYSLFQLRCFEGLDFAIRQDDRAEFQESIEKLRNAHVLS